MKSESEYSQKKDLLSLFVFWLLWGVYSFAISL